MFDYIGNVLYHVLIILFPILFYHQFLNKAALHLNRRTDYRFITILVIMLFFTMSFPVEMPNGNEYDLKVIPFIIAFIYGGIVPGFFIFGSMFIYKLILGDDGLLMAFINFGIVAVILSMFKWKITALTKKSKVNIITGIILLIILSRTMRLLVSGQYEQVLFGIIFSFITWITLITVVLIIENLKMQMNLQTELQRSEKLKVISELAASVAHEVRNPMTSTRGFLQLMKEDVNLNSVQKDYIRISLGELDRAQSIIQDYLSLAKPNKQEIGTINLSLEVENVIQLMSSYTNIQNVLFVHKIEDSLYLKANKDEIKQVLINIIKNGIEAVETGGIITVNAYKKKQDIIIEVIDNGVGMTARQIKNLGTPFYSTKEKGTGIGLTISFQIIELLKGKIEIESEEGKGSKFSIRLPCLEG